MRAVVADRASVRLSCALCVVDWRAAVGARSAWQRYWKGRIKDVDLFVEPTEHARVAALQAHHLSMSLRMGHEQASGGGRPHAGHEVQVHIPQNLQGADAVAFMWKQFHGVHDQTFGFNYEGEQDVEVVNLRVQAVGMQHRPSLKPETNTRSPAEPFGTRRVYWRASGWVNCPLYRRTELAIGQTVTGPAIVEEYGSTVVVPQLWSAKPDAYGNLILEKAA